MVALKDLGAAFIAKCDEIGGSRELSLGEDQCRTGPSCGP